MLALQVRLSHGAAGCAGSTACCHLLNNEETGCKHGYACTVLHLAIGIPHATILP